MVVILGVVHHLVMCQLANGVEESRYRRMGMEIEAVDMAEVEAEVVEVEEEGTDELQERDSIGISYVEVLQIACFRSRLPATFIVHKPELHT